MSVRKAPESAVEPGTHAGRVDRHVLRIRINRQCLKNTREYATYTPPTIAPVDGNSIAEAVRQVTPGNARAIAEDDGINEQAIVRGRPTDMAFAAGQEISDPSPPFSPLQLI